MMGRVIVCLRGTMKVWNFLCCLTLVFLACCGDEAAPTAGPAGEVDEGECEGGDCPPELTILSPESGAGFNVLTPLVVEATDDQGVALIQVFVDGDLLTETVESRLEDNLDASRLSEGPHTLSATVLDSVG
jgi:hypothetical protein